MGRFIKILQEMQNNPSSLSLSYLSEKFSVTARTLQRDIQRINALLSEISDCRIIKSKDQLILVGHNCEFAINSLLAKFLRVSKNDQLKDYLLLLIFIWESQPLSSVKLLNFTGGDLYNLRQEIDSINNFLQYYQLNLSLKFVTKKGWMLVGCEQELRFLAVNILTKLDHNGYLTKSSYPNIAHSYLFVNLFDLINKLEKLKSSSIFQFYYPEIMYFLILVVRRVKINKSLNSYHCHLLFQQLLDSQSNIAVEKCEQLVNLLTVSFALKFNQSEIAYLKAIMFLSQQQIDNNLFFIQINQLKKSITELVLKKYQLSLKIKEFKKTLNNFLINNYLKLLLNCYKKFDFNDFKKSPFLINNVYYFGWEILSIISFACQQLDIKINFNFLIDEYWLMSFDSLYLATTKQNWIIPLYYQAKKNSYLDFDRILNFIDNKYPNIKLESFSINKNVYQWYLWNKSYAILFDSCSRNLVLNKKVFLIKNYHLISNKQLQSEIDRAIKMISFSKIASSILIFDFFCKQKFYNLKSFLNFFENLLVRKFKLNLVNFDLKNAFLNWKFHQANILLIHKLIPIENIELPIILIYLKNPLFFHKKSPIHFIFVFTMNAKSWYQYDWVLLYLNWIKNNLKIKITSIKNLYQIFINSLPQESLAPY